MRAKYQFFLHLETYNSVVGERCIYYYIYTHLSMIWFKRRRLTYRIFPKLQKKWDMYNDILTPIRTDTKYIEHWDEMPRFILMILIHSSNCHTNLNNLQLEVKGISLQCICFLTHVFTHYDILDRCIKKSPEVALWVLSLLQT